MDFFKWNLITGHAVNKALIQGYSRPHFCFAISRPQTGTQLV